MEISKMEPITEASNPITADIDLADSAGIVALLNQCDAEIFTGCELYKSLYDPYILAAINQVAEIASSVLKDDKGCVVLSGCGTSGRLSFLVAHTFNKILKQKGLEPKFAYTIAGGDRALLLSTEAPEDSWEAGVQDLMQVTEEMNPVLFIGITCGLSAPYVAGQLDYCIQHIDRCIPVLLGFNPVKLARKVPIVNWNKTFYDVAHEMEELSSTGKNCYIINPVVGPEPITGSSRMKSGSATKIILETLFIISMNDLMSDSERTGKKFPVDKIFQAYEILYRQTYIQSPQIVKLVEHAGQAFWKGGHIYYLGKGNLGVMALIDASECPPTYGSSYNDVRGFIEGGWGTLENREGDISSRGPEYELDLSSYKQSILPHLTKHDCVIFVCDQNNITTTQIADLVNTDCFVGIISSSADETKILPKETVNLTLPVSTLTALLSPYISHSLLTLLFPTFSEICVKWTLNSISTGAHVMKGKVLGNRMVDLQVSNSKLYHRAIGIIQMFAGVESTVAEQKLLNSIYGTDYPNAKSCTIQHHIKTATGQSMVVPKAIVMAQSDCSLEEAHTLLQSNPVVRKALKQT